MQPTHLDPWQFTVASSPSDDSRQVGSMHLRCGAGVAPIAVCDSAGREVGVMVGFPIDLKAEELVVSSTALPFAYDGDPDGFSEQVLRHFAGIFVWLFATSDTNRLYLDALAQFPCVFDAERKVAGSTSHALLDERQYDERFDERLFERLNVSAQGWFPAGLTAHRGIERLLPNHYLDLDAWTSTRHWPKAPLDSLEDPHEAIAEIVELVRAQLRALLKTDRSLCQALTAGRESRMLLGCARPYLSSIEFVTVTGQTGRQVDREMARVIASDQGLLHRELPLRRSDPDGTALFVRRNGHCVADGNSEFFPSVAPIRASHFSGGLGGEVGRGFLWRESDGPDQHFDGAGLNARFGLPGEPVVVDSLDRWLSGLDGIHGYQVLDLAYLENRMGPWSGAQLCGDPTLVRFAPLVTGRAVELMLRLPPEWKRGERLCDEMVEQTWPELDGYPYNTLGRLRDLSSHARRILMNPRLVARKIRKTFR